MDTPRATYKGVVMPLARWTDQSDLAMVKGWFYPQHIKLGSKTKSKTQGSTAQVPDFDPYAPDIPMDAFDQDSEIDDEDNQGGGHVVSFQALNTTTANETSTSQSEAIPSLEPSQQNRNKRRAIERVGTYQWHDHRVPHAITATAELIDAQLHYEEGYIAPQTFNNVNATATSKTSFQISQGAMKSIFAMAFCRFVNGFVDRDVVKSKKAMRETGLGPMAPVNRGRGANITKANEDESDSSDGDGEEDEDEDEEEKPTISESGTVPKGAGESSMYKHASTIGMPTSFVDLRHKATHGKDPPNLRELRSYTDQALQWLWDKWWKVHVKGDAEYRIEQLRKWNEAMAECERAFPSKMKDVRGDQTGTDLKMNDDERQNYDMNAHTVRDEDERVREEDDDGGDKSRSKREQKWQWTSVQEDGCTKFVRVSVAE